MGGLRIRLEVENAVGSRPKGRCWRGLLACLPALKSAARWAAGAASCLSFLFAFHTCSCLASRTRFRLSPPHTHLFSFSFRAHLRPTPLAQGNVQALTQRRRVCMWAAVCIAALS
jgi:hypothetical protein